MGKKLKKKTNRNTQKEKQFPTSSRNNISEKIPTMIVDGGAIEKETRLCPHIETGINLDKVSSKITSVESPKCDDCREGAVDRRGSKPKGKHSKKKASGSTSDSKSIWVCLECGQFTCGGIGFPTVPHTHATRHSKQNHHPLAIQFANPNLRFCFPCNTLIPVQVSEENGEEKDVFSSVVKVLKTRPSSEKNTLDVEDVWFGNGSVISEVKSVNTEIIPGNSGGFYMVKGLNNLGNTCFFNSILQNLLAMDKLRDHFMKLETPVGPLSVSLKKLFVKTNPSTIDKSVINPRSLFNSICTMASQFKGYQQQDSHELLRFLLDGLCNEECGKDRNVPKEHPTFVDALFGGQICSSVSCLECGHTSNVYEPYLDLSLPLSTKKSPSKKMPLVSKSKKPNSPPKRREKVGTKVHRASDSSPPATQEDIMEKISGITIMESGIPSDDCNGNSNSSDISSWLDYLEPTKVSSDSWLDYLDPCSSNNHDMVSRNGIQDSGDGNEHIWEDLDEAPRVQESEILLLPYKELMPTSNGNGNEMAEETSDFDGFGGLFDEPEAEVEVVSGPSVKNNSDSDSDEVDNSDCQVSVDKCLAYFTTSEILSKTDHAWQCEQCTKALLEQRTRLKNKSNGTGTGIGIASIPSDSGIEHSYSNGNGIPSIPSDSGVEDSVSNEVGNGNGNGNGVASELEERGSVENGGNLGLSHHQSSVTDSNGHDSNGVEDEVDSSSVKVIRDASKRILISKVPPILTIHLKRLSQDARGRLSKLNGHVDFKDTIDLEPYMDPSCCKDKGRHTYRYRLIGMVEHSGSARGGHYVAYVRGGLKDDWVWYHASDAHVREVSLEEVFGCEAYILFYEKM